jgi:iron complex outermembrane receptor protein
LIDLDYTPTDNILAYAKYSRGYRSGLIVQNISAPFNIVQPEKVDAYEAGLKTSFDGLVKGTFDVAGFYNDFSNQQVLIGFDPYNNAPVAPTAAPVNIGTSHIYGAELEATIIPYDGVTLDFAYTYLNASLASVRALPTIVPPYVVAGTPKPGDPLELSPRNKLSFTPSYTLPVDESIGKITLSATFTHSDKQLTNYIDRGYPIGAAPSTLGMPISSMSYVPATNLLDLNVNWESVAGKPIDLSIFATNVTGEKYYTWFPGLSSATSFETAEVGPPCFYGVRLKYHFGED